MYGSKRVAVRDLNPHILCALCGGYLIQATTVIECLHSFCRSCIVNFLETSKVCPICDAQIHKTRPLLNIRPDQTLQSLVYKLVPGLFQDEMRRRREFHATLSESDVEDLSLEERGEASLEKEFKPGDDHVSLVLQLVFREDKNKPFEIRDRRYLLCPSEVTVQHLKKFIRMKFQLTEKHKIEMFRAKEELTDDLMLQDIALIYSWRKEKPMNICYTVVESPKAKSKGCQKQPVLVSKQSEVCHTSPETKQTFTSETSLNQSVLSNLHESSSHLLRSSSHLLRSPSVLSETPAIFPETPVVPSPIIKNEVFNSTTASVSMVPLSTSSPSLVNSSSNTSAILSSIISTEPLTSLCSIVDKSLPSINKSPSTVNFPTNNNIKDFKTLHVISISTGSKTATSTSVTPTMATLANNLTLKSKTTVAKQTELMHSVESILKKTLKKTHHKNNPTTLSWTPVSELQEQSEGNVYKDKQHKAASKVSKLHNLHSSRVASNTPDSDRKSSERLEIPGIKRSQSALDPCSLGAKVDGHALKPQDIINNNHTTTADEPLHVEVTDDVFSSYIPKFQKHRKLCSVKRSASYEGPSVAIPVQGTTTVGDAMEKRNWKKRKLSTLDFEVAEVTAVDSHTSNTTSMSGSDSRDTKQKEATSQSKSHRHVPSLSEDKPSGEKLQNSGSPIDKSVTSSSKDTSIPHSTNHPPALLQQDCTTVNSFEKPHSKYSTSDAKVKSSSRKFNHTATTASPSKHSNKLLLENKNCDSAQTVKVDKVKIVSGKKQSRVTNSDSDFAKMFVSKKSMGYIMNKSSKSLNNKLDSESGHGSANVGSVEEIRVDISTSPVDVSNVTSPATYVTSPGTEDRTDGSALPDIQTSCGNNCVVTFSGKVVPLDLSTKKKK